jgi:hypothetical protein
VIIGICLVWPVRGVNYLRYQLVPGSLVKIRDLSNLIFDSFITSPAPSPRNSINLSSRGSHLRRGAAAGSSSPASAAARPTEESDDGSDESELAGVSGVALDEEEQGDEAGVLSDHHHVPPHSMVPSAHGADKTIKTRAAHPAVPIVKGNTFARAH